MINIKAIGTFMKEKDFVSISEFLKGRSEDGRSNEVLFVLSEGVGVSGQVNDLHSVYIIPKEDWDSFYIHDSASHFASPAANTPDGLVYHFAQIAFQTYLIEMPAHPSNFLNVPSHVDAS